VGEPWVPPRLTGKEGFEPSKEVITPVILNASTHADLAQQSQPPTPYLPWNAVVVMPG
jgi:hypothetical protein